MRTHPTPPTLPTGLLLLFPIAILSIICMRPTVTVVAYGLYVCVFVGNEHELCKNAWTDRCAPVTLYIG